MFPMPGECEPAPDLRAPHTRAILTTFVSVLLTSVLPSAAAAGVGVHGPVVTFGGQQYAVSVGAPAFESAAFDATNDLFASRDFLYNACAQPVSAGPTEGPGLAWDADTGYFWQITNDRVVRRWDGGTIVDTVFVIPPTFDVVGSGPDTLDAPKGLALDDTYVYVVDAGPDPGQIASNAWFKFTRTGTPVKSSKSTNFTQHLDADPDALVDDIVYSPMGSPIFPGRLLIALEHSGIQVIDVEGSFVTKLMWSSDPSLDGIKPFGFAGLTLDPDTGNLFIVDNDGGKSQVWTRLTTSPAQYVIGVSGGHGYLHQPTHGCNRQLWRPISSAPNAPGLIFGVAYRPLDGKAYGMDFGSGDLWRFDPLSGAGELVDETGIDNIWGLAYDSERDVLYAGRELLGGEQIFVVDPDNGAEFDLPNPVGHYLNDLAFDPGDGHIYGMESQTLIRIDRDSGLGTVVGTSTQFCRGLEYDPSTTKLIGITNGPIKLWSIDQATAATTFIADLQNDTGWEGLAVIALPELVAVSGPDGVPSPVRLRLTPNPTAGSTTIRFDLLEAQRVEVLAFDSAGRLVSRVFDGTLGAGSRQVMWNGQDATGRALPSGVYWVRARAGTSETSGRVLIVR